MKTLTQEELNQQIDNMYEKKRSWSFSIRKNDVSFVLVWRYRNHWSFAFCLLWFEFIYARKLKPEGYTNTVLGYIHEGPPKEAIETSG